MPLRNSKNILKVKFAHLIEYILEVSWSPYHFVIHESSVHSEYVCMLANIWDTAKLHPIIKRYETSVIKNIRKKLLSKNIFWATKKHSFELIKYKSLFRRLLWWLIKRSIDLLISREGEVNLVLTFQPRKNKSADENGGRSASGFHILYANASGHIQVGVWDLLFYWSILEAELKRKANCCACWRVGALINEEY